MAPDAATDVLVQAASALAAAHRSGVVHRDVKPANLLLGPGGITKLGDFGMALGLSDLRTGTAHLRVGTPYYTAPEIWRGEAATPASDIYSLGATYFQLLTGTPPYPGNDVAAIEQAHLRAPVPDPRDRVPAVPASCAALVKKALSKSPRERQASAQELAWEGRRVLQELAASVAPGAAAPGSGRAEPDPDAAPAVAEWARALGFARTPFAEIDPAVPLYQGEPFSSLRVLLVSRADDQPTAVVALTGAEGSGRTALCRRLVMELAPTRLVLAADLPEAGSGQGLMRRWGRMLGAGDLAAAGSLEAIVERLEEERRRTGVRPLLIVDGVVAPPMELLALLRAAAVTRSFKVLVVGAPGLASALVRAGLELDGGTVPEVEIPPLRREQVLSYVQGWVAATLDGRAPPLLFSPDALLLVALRSAGNPGRINRIAENMLVLAAARGRRTLTTFEAWTAPDRERWAVLPASALPRRPAGWPPPEVLSAIDACRRSCGMQPWPRSGGEPLRSAPDRSVAGGRNS